MERKEAIRSAYRLTGGNNFYDGMITCSTLSGKAVCRLVWDMNKAENDAYLEKAMSGIPEHFSGKLLEVPVGTGILTIFIPSVEHNGIVKKGQKLAVIADPLTGEVRQTLMAPADGLLFTLREYPVVYPGSLLARILTGGFQK